MLPTLIPRRLSAGLVADGLLIGCLVALGVVARLLPHAPNVTPIAASALFAASVLRTRALAPIVPLAAMILGDVVLGFPDWRVMAVVYAASALPAALAFLPRRVRAPGPLLAAMLGSSLAFFLTTNLAVWAFSGLYETDFGGLMQCYVAALPFLRNTFAGDLGWSALLFGCYWLVRYRAARPRSVAAIGR